MFFKKPPKWWFDFASLAAATGFGAALGYIGGWQVALWCGVVFVVAILVATHKSLFQKKQ